MQSQSSAYLRCVVHAGQFSDEYGVQGIAYDGAGFSLFVPAEFVQLEQPFAGTAVPGWVSVEILDRGDNLALIELPEQTFENGRTVTVMEDQLREAAAQSSPG